MENLITTKWRRRAAARMGWQFVTDYIRLRKEGHAAASAYALANGMHIPGIIRWMQQQC